MAFLFLLPPIASSATFDVVNYGAIGDGKTDDSQAFLRAWAEVCNDASATGPCKPSSITVQITGVIVAPGDVKAWRGNNANWLMFSDVNGLTLTGTGRIDGQGQGWWDMCPRDNKMQVLMNGCNNLVVKGLKLVNSQRSHLAIVNCNDVLLSQLTITAPEESPNTDGIDVANSRRVRIEWSTIATGDDCIAINRGTFQINITGIADTLDESLNNAILEDPPGNLGKVNLLRD
ncbi:putative polygalacturonase At3g15720 [Curcuma longa]|uniref:putative polygalacturonase At3g15720 n=1 Tax=Curcuma longa TaxID=136217 RepID=UPI003D9F9FF9